MSQIVRIARRINNSTQREFAATCGEHQSAIAALESGSRGISQSHLERILAQNSLRLIPIFTNKHSVCEVADDIYQSLNSENFESAFRRVIQLSDDLRSADSVELVCLTATTPPPTSDPRFDALLSGLCDYYLSRLRLPKPAWLSQTLKLPEPWFVDDNPRFHAQIRKTTPKAFAKLNVFIAESEFASV